MENPWPYGVKMAIRSGNGLLPDPPAAAAALVPFREAWEVGPEAWAVGKDKKFHLLDLKNKVTFLKKTAFKIVFIYISCLFAFLFASRASAEWETGAKIGFDSNIDRAIDNEQSDAYLSASLSFLRGPSGESRVDWTLAATLEGSLFFRLTDLSYGALTLAPGITLIPHRVWTINLSPFFQAKGVGDSDQSALAFGGKIGMRQEIGKDLYTGQYYLYKDSRAEEDIYSFIENALGVYVGKSWSRAFYTEIGYEYSYGDSFRTFDTPPPGGSGRGKQHRYQYSSTFGKEVIKEKVKRQSIGVSGGIDWTKYLFSTITYTYTTIYGDSGSSSSQAGFVSLVYRF